jgi:aldehyde:ferredoxin oxidoreductase
MIYCDFWGSIESKIIAEIFSVAFGKRFTPEYMDKAGERIWNLGRMFNVKSGFSRKDDYLPHRTLYDVLSEGPAKGKVLSEKAFNTMISDYYSLRGWDSNGIPTDKKLNELDIREDELTNRGRDK